MRAKTEATNMSAQTPSGVKKSRLKKERSKQNKLGRNIEARVPSGGSSLAWPTSSPYGLAYIDYGHYASSLSRYNGGSTNIAKGV